MKPKFALGLLLLGAVSFAPTFIAQARPANVKVHTPKAGSRERAAILDAAREPIRKFFKVKTVNFAGIESFRVGGGWAHLYAQTFDEYGRRLEPDGDPDSSVGVTMLLQLEGKRWRVVEWAYVAEPIEVEWAKEHSECPLNVVGLKASDLK